MPHPGPLLARTPADIGHAIRAARKARGLTQTQLATLSNVGQATISKLESGAVVPTLETVFDILAVLDLELQVTPRSRSGDLEDLF
ncbi:helix-turn-helix domain-containing protein [Thioclava kandeliae]|uniref:Helix-turn-helix transcriptional regulator n=1 Tax=Thioclava kandeliae TaxID=3070818 RepID=A0ABV1SHJ9_9RHOB